MRQSCTSFISLSRLVYDVCGVLWKEQKLKESQDGMKTNKIDSTIDIMSFSHQYLEKKLRIMRSIAEELMWRKHV